MADPRGFLKVERREHAERPAAERIGDYREIVIEPSSEELALQASRCMDCGIPFCHQGCPLGNLIPEFNDLLHRGDPESLERAKRVLLSTNNFPELTGRVCPAPCEASCVLGIENAPVTIKDVERTLANAIFAEEELVPQIAPTRTGRNVAIVGSGPAGLACAQQLARAGHHVVVYERDDRIGGLLRYGIPDFKMEKGIIDRRMVQMQAEGVVFRTSVDVSADELLSDYDAVVLATGARVPRDLSVPGRDLAGIHFAMDYLEQQNRRVAGDATPPSERAIVATGKHVVVIGGGDTGSDCVGTANRQGAASVTQLELMAKPPLVRMPENPWPAWPLVLRTSSSHEEGCVRDFAVMTTRFEPDANGRVAKLVALRLPEKTDEIALPCDLALLAMGFTGPEKNGLVDDLGLALDGRGNIVTAASGSTNVAKVFAAGDASRGQSLVVWAIADGRRVAAGVNAFLGDVGLRAVG